ncbi:hypothetical protein X975_11155, partial [Stegodyphus mimosarum]
MQLQIPLTMTFKMYSDINAIFVDKELKCYKLQTSVILMPCHKICLTSQFWAKTLYIF